jgi:hypothetical protein
MIIAADRKQARVIMRFALGLLQAVPMLKRQIESTTQESISLRTAGADWSGGRANGEDRAE